MTAWQAQDVVSQSGAGDVIWVQCTLTIELYYASVNTIDRRLAAERRQRGA